MKIRHSLLLIGLLGGATATNAQSGADTQLVIRDTTQARQAPARKTGSGQRPAAARGAIEVSLPAAVRDSLIKNIRIVFHRINRDTALRAVSLEEETMEEVIGGSPDNGGDVTGYFKKDTIYKLVMSFGPSYGMKDWEYYYDRGQVVFIYEKDQHFPVKKDGGGLDHERLVVGFEGRFYFNNGRLVEKIVKRYDQFMAENIDDKYIKDLLDDSDLWVGAFRKQVKQKK